MEWPKIIMKDELPPNPNRWHLPNRIYQAFAGLTIPVVTPLGDYGFWCPFVSETDQSQATGVMCSAELLMTLLEEERPKAARWFHRNMPQMASGKCGVEGEVRPLMIVFPSDVEEPHHGAIAHDRAIHDPTRVPA